MKTNLRPKKGYLMLFLLWLIIGGYFLITLQKGDAILYFNQFQNPTLNDFFKIVTQLGEELVYIFLIIAGLFYRFRWSILFLLTGLLVALVSFLAKSFFQYDRPFTYFTKLGRLEEINWIEGVYVLKGTTSFPSGHTMSGFAIYALVFLCFHKNRWALPLFLLSLLVGLSRIYLNHHFLMDVYLGSILGVGIAYFLYLGQKRLPIRSGHWLDQSVMQLPFLSFRNKTTQP